jgi:cell division protein FtsL
MQEEKKKRVMSAITSGIIMLLVILITISVYQIAGIIKRHNKINQLNSEIAYLEAQLQNTNDEIDSWSLKWKIEERARELGLEYPIEK